MMYDLVVKMIQVPWKQLMRHHKMLSTYMICTDNAYTSEDGKAI